jgi:hypothetical protein
MVQVLENLPSKYEALSSSPNTTRKYVKSLTQHSHGLWCIELPFEPCYKFSGEDVKVLTSTVLGLTLKVTHLFILEKLANTEKAHRTQESAQGSRLQVPGWMFPDPKSHSVRTQHSRTFSAWSPTASSSERGHCVFRLLTRKESVVEGCFVSSYADTL